MFTPLTAVYLCNTPLKKDNKNQLLFNSRGEQFEYFNSKTVHRFSDFTYQRKDNIIRVPINAEILFNDGVNYVMYDNKNFSNRWIYAFVEKIEYINDNVSHVHIKTDVFQTWFLECEINPCFVVRETVINDDLFKHTLPENLPTGEQITVEKKEIGGSLAARNSEEFNNNYYCVVCTSEIIKFLSNTIPRIDSFIGGVANPCYYYATTLDSFYDFIDKINENGQASAIVSCVAIPKFFCKFTELQTATGGDGSENNNPSTEETGVLFMNTPYTGSFQITQSYKGEEHDGLDIVGIDSKNIHSTVNGTVVHADWQNADNHGEGFGLYVRILDDATGYYFYYGHLSEINVNVGDTVAIGDKIGVEGNTGYSTGSHCHYCARIGWETPVDICTLFGIPNEEGTYTK